MSISLDEFERGCRAFQKNEPRDAMYRIATFVVSQLWGKPRDMADGLGVLLLTWNQALYRYGPFDFDKLEDVIRTNLRDIGACRKRGIATLQNPDEPLIVHLFERFLDGLQIASGKLKGRQSPVAVAKALHLLAPAFFPIWDDKIARAYGCHYGKAPAKTYVAFSYKMKEIAGLLESRIKTDDKTILKLIDEYNYAKFTKGWL